MVLVHRVRHVDFTEVLGQLNMLYRRHLLIPKKDNLVCHECVVDGLCTLGSDVAQIDIELGTQCRRQALNSHFILPVDWSIDLYHRSFLFALRIDF